MKALAPFIGVALLSSLATAAILVARPGLIAALIPPGAPTQSATGNAEPADGTPDAANPAAPTDQTVLVMQQEIDWLYGIIDQLQDENQSLQQRLQQVTPSRRSQTAANGVWFDDKALRAIGMAPADFAPLRDKVEDLEMRKLTLRSSAVREGWSPEQGKALYQQLRELDQQFRDSLTPDEYDTVLYATGKTNRVGVSDVLGNSAAHAAGIRRGDIIYSYNGERVFDPASLFRETTRGTLGEMVPVTVLRDGEKLILYLPRGPLGTRFHPTRAAPTLR